MSAQFTVFLKKGDREEEGAALYRAFERQFGRKPSPSEATEFQWLFDRRFTIAVVSPGWWEDQLRDLGWVAIDYDLWLDVMQWATDPANRARLEALVGPAAPG